MSDAVSVTLVSDPQSPIGRAGVNIHVSCTANLSAIVNIPATVQIQLLDPVGRVLPTVTSNSSASSIYTSRALINSFEDEYAGSYTCRVTLSTPASQSITKTETIHIYVGKMFIFLHTFSVDNYLSQYILR